MMNYLSCIIERFLCFVNMLRVYLGKNFCGFLNYMNGHFACGDKKSSLKAPQKEAGVALCGLTML